MAKDYQQMYREKLRSAAEVAQTVKPGNLIDYAMFTASR
jgi:acyl-CoA hydrolase